MTPSFATVTAIGTRHDEQRPRRLGDLSDDALAAERQRLEACRAELRQKIGASTTVLRPFRESLSELTRCEQRVADEQERRKRSPIYPKAFTTPEGRVVPISVMAKALKNIRLMPELEYPGWNWFATPGHMILAEVRRGIHDRINRR